jgi:Na+/melibiose symporter-like transporter
MSAAIPITAASASQPVRFPATETRHGPARLLSFAAISMPLAAVEVPLSTYVPPLYASAFGFDLATVGLIFLAARLWDAFIDPGIGILSDRTRSRFGRRRPWIAAGGVIFGLAAVPVFLPPVGFGPVALSLALFTMYLGYSMIATPYAAWGGELSSRYHERTRVVTYSQITTSVALLLALVLPSLLARRYADDPRLQLAAMGAMVFVLLIPSLVLGLRALPEPPLPTRANPPLELRKTLALVFADRLLLRVLASNFAVRLGQGIRTAVFVFFVTFYMGKPTWAPALFLLQYVFGILAGPIWHAVGKRVGKSRAAVAGELVQAAINFALILLTPGAVPLLVALTVAQGLAQGSGNLMLRSMVADVADHHHLETGEDRIGLFFSVFSLSDKAAFAVAVGVALPLVAWLGFDPRHTNTPAALEHLKWVFALGPALAHVLSAAVINGFPINENNHAEIRRMLAARDAAGLVSDPRREQILASEEG